jgi:tetratricopeptide (TPR) repeat protein
MTSLDLASQAIDAALKHDWKTAVALNLQLLKSNPKDIDALNRLGKAYLQQGLKTKSEETYKKTLKVDKFNPIATKALETIKNYKVERGVGPTILSANSPMFLEEPGTTKTVNLTRLGDIKTLSHLQPGDEVYLAPREHCVSVVNQHQENVGRLPDDLASRLRPFLKAGSTYQVWIKSVDVHPTNQAKQNVRIFVREVIRAHKFKNIPSFPSTEKLTYAAFTPPELIHTEKPDISTPEEDNENFMSVDDSMDENDSEKLPLPPPDDD